MIPILTLLTPSLFSLGKGTRASARCKSPMSLLTGKTEVDCFHHTHQPTFVVVTQSLYLQMGVGTLWDEYGLVRGGGTCSYQSNTFATREFQSITGCDFAVPINQGDCAHWSRDCFGGEELMGPVESNSAALSKITLGSLQDMGYQVDYSKADSTNGAFFQSRCQCNRRLQEEALASNTTMSESKPRRQLSDEGRAIAEAYGLSVLEETRAEIDQMQSLLPMDDANVTDIGGHVIAVMYEEDGIAYDVIVRSGTFRRD